VRLFSISTASNSKPSNPYNQITKTDCIKKAYNSIFAGTGKLCKDEGLYINRDDYASGCVLYALHLSADLSEDDHFSLVCQGSVRLALKFAATLAATVTVIAYTELKRHRGRPRQKHRSRFWSMNSDEIDRFLRARVRVFSVDNLPDNRHLLVCNTDHSGKPGRHWVAIYIEDGRGEVFDSFGHRPNIDFERYMNRHCVSWKFNDKQLQSIISKFGGHYCIYFCILVVEVKKFVKLCVVSLAILD